MGLRGHGTARIQGRPDNRAEQRPRSSHGRNPEPWLLGRRARWLLILGALVGYTVALTSLDRYFEWDEAVFYSQSGPLDGSTNGPSPYLPSRELGTPWIIAACRAFGLTVVGVRVVWILLAVVLIWVAFRQAGRGTAWAGEIGAVLFGTYWITGAYLGSFFGSLLGALFAVVATAMYLRLQDENAPSLWVGVLLGLGLAGSLYMRAVETALVVAVLLMHSLLWQRAQIWRCRLAALALSVATVAVTFVLPWLIHSTLVYGSPLGHLAAWAEERHRRQASGGFAVSPHDSLGAWLDVLTGNPGHFAVEGIPTWSRVAIAVALGGFAAAAASRLVGWGRNRGAARPTHLGLFGLLAFVSFALFWFAVDAINDRYALYGAAFTAVVAGHLVARGVRRWMPRRRLGLRELVLVAGLLAWIVANGTVVRAYDRTRDHLADDDRTVVMVVERAAANRPCALISGRFPRPPISIATRCATMRAKSGRALQRRIRAATNRGENPFVLWAAPGSPPPIRRSWHLIARVAIRPSTHPNYSIYAPGQQVRWH